jgi:ubiquitin-conjugating enzyme E2 Z
MNAKKSIKRIQRDIANIIKNDTLQTQDKIFCLFNDKDIYDVKALIVGPVDTPYEGGFFFFKLKFPDNYPENPPSAKLQTLASKVRFNPNLYEEGKVCLSILGTWEGPGWTPCMTMTTVLTSMQSLMSEMPYRNEPGHDNDSDVLCHKYNDCINYHNFRVAIIGMLNNPASGYIEFLPIIEKLFVKGFDRYSKIITDLKNAKQGQKIIAPAPFTTMSADCDYIGLQNEMNDLYNKLSPKYTKILADEAKIEKHKNDNLSPKTDIAKKIASQKTMLFD